MRLLLKSQLRSLGARNLFHVSIAGEGSLSPIFTASATQQMNRDARPECNRPPTPCAAHYHHAKGFAQGLGSTPREMCGISPVNAPVFAREARASDGRAEDPLKERLND